MGTQTCETAERAVANMDELLEQVTERHGGATRALLDAYRAMADVALRREGDVELVLGLLQLAAAALVAVLDRR